MLPLVRWLRGQPPRRSNPANPRFGRLDFDLDPLLDRLAISVLRPEREHLQDARPLAQDLRSQDGAEAWERFEGAGILDQSWAAGLGGPRFSRAIRVGRGSRALADPPETPPTVEEALAAASDPDGLIACEALAREYFARMERLFGPSLTQATTSWAFFSSVKDESPIGFTTGASPGLHSMLEEKVPELLGPRSEESTLLSLAIDGELLVRNAEPRGFPRLERLMAFANELPGWINNEWRTLLGLDLAAHCAWRALGDKVIDPSYWAMDPSRRKDPPRFYAQIPSPIEPLLSIWALGYAPIFWDVRMHESLLVLGGMAVPHLREITPREARP